jgi:NAD(P)H dehydrogenase (quinone)
MKHLIVVAHPAADSFTMGLARTYAAELEQLGHSQQTLDLYRMGFNPILSAAELVPASANHPASADVARAQDEIRAAGVLTVIYPLWWMSMPAMMKGYIDRAFLSKCERTKTPQLTYINAAAAVRNKLSVISH